jgi:hypothetical protein
MSELKGEKAGSGDGVPIAQDVFHYDKPLEHFIECPDIFAANLTPEQHQARQELYQVAYERAQAEARKKRAAFVAPFIWGDGI